MGMIYTKLLIDELGDHRTSFMKSDIEEIISERRNNVTVVR